MTDLQIIHTVGSLRQSAGGPSRTVTALCAELGRLDLQIDLFSQDIPTADPDDDQMRSSDDRVRTTLIKVSRVPGLGWLESRLRFGAALRERCEIAGCPARLWLSSTPPHHPRRVAGDHAMTYLNPTTSLRTPDPILAELWEVKRQINAEAGYRLEELTRMARESAEKIRHQWQQEELTLTEGEREKANHAD